MNSSIILYPLLYRTTPIFPQNGDWKLGHMSYLPVGAPYKSSRTIHTSYSRVIHQTIKPLLIHCWIVGRCCDNITRTNSFVFLYLSSRARISTMSVSFRSNSKLSGTQHHMRSRRSTNSGLGFSSSNALSKPTKQHFRFMMHWTKCIKRLLIYDDVCNLFYSL